MTISLDRKLNRRKLVVQISMALICACVFFFIIIPLVQAGLKDDNVSNLSKLIRSLVGLNSKELIDIFTEGKEWGFLAGGVDSPGYNFFDTMMKATRTIAAGLVIIQIFIEVISAAAKNEANLDFLLKIGARLGIMLVIITNLNVLLNSIHDFFTYAVSNMATVGNDTVAGQIDDYLKTFTKDAFKGVSYISLFISALAIKFGSFLITVILMIIVRIRAYALVLEIAVRRVFMPVALVGFVQDGPRSSGLRYLLKYAGAYFRVLIYIGSFVAADYLYLYVIQTGILMADAVPVYNIATTFKIIIAYIGLSIAAVVLARKGDQLVDEILGINGGG